jgi:hypothetical protein
MIEVDDGMKMTMRSQRQGQNQKISTGGRRRVKEEKKRS